MDARGREEEKGEEEKDETHGSPEGRDARNMLDRTFTTPEVRLMGTRGKKKEVRGPGPAAIGNASVIAWVPSLACEGDSKTDQRKLEKLERPRRFQEGEELTKRRNATRRSLLGTIPLLDALLDALLNALTVRKLGWMRIKAGEKSCMIRKAMAPLAVLSLLLSPSSL